MSVFSTGSNVLLIFLGFGMLIFIHELGHFLAAKWVGIRAEGFCVGFGAPLISYRRGVGVRLGGTDQSSRKILGKAPIQCSSRELEEAGIGETEYALRMIPLGGYVRMLGQDDMDPGSRSLEPNSFNAKPIWQRMIVISAGIIMNLILAIALFITAFMAGVDFNAPVIGEVIPGDPAAVAGIESGDTIVSIDGTPTQTFADIQIGVAFAAPGEEVEVEVRSADDGSLRTISMMPEMNPAAGLLGIGVTPASSSTLNDAPESASLVENAIESAGLTNSGVGPGWRIVRAGSKPITTWSEWAKAFETAGSAPVEVTWAPPAGPEAGHEVPVSMQGLPQLEPQRYPEEMPQSVANYELGLLGMTPLVEIMSVLPTSPNHATLKAGDVILRAGNDVGPMNATFRAMLQKNAGGSIPITLLRDGERIESVVEVNRSGQVGVLIGSALGSPVIARPMPLVGNPVPGEAPLKTAVSALDLMPLTTITSVGGRPVTDWTTLREGFKEACRDATGAVDVPVVIENPTPGRESETVTFRLSERDVETLGELGWSAPIGIGYFEPIWTTLTAKGNPITAVEMGYNETRKMVILTYFTIYRLTQGTVGVEQLRGPVGIVHLGSRVADRGMMYLLFFLAMISVNLAVLNFLPLPILDGGHFIYLIYEKIKGRPPSVGFQNYAALVGLLLIGSLFVVTFYNDVMRLIG
ncbi:MAG TPA: hypothetical protein DCX60_09495 [Phycisphaerales bacterium]|nr:hypothetical protein [Phycisphaerales bacterium]